VGWVRANPRQSLRLVARCGAGPGSPPVPAAWPSKRGHGKLWLADQLAPVWASNWRLVMGPGAAWVCWASHALATGPNVLWLRWGGRRSFWAVLSICSGQLGRRRGEYSARPLSGSRRGE
jgi:hypothetical protein